MTTKKQPAAKKPAEGPAGRPENPFVSAEFYNRMRDYTERDAAFSKELQSIALRGASKQATDARTSSRTRAAPSNVVLPDGVVVQAASTTSARHAPLMPEL